MTATRIPNWKAGIIQRLRESDMRVVIRRMSSGDRELSHKGSIIARGCSSLAYHARTYCQAHNITRYYDKTRDKYEEV
jgi:hypothetical protein